MHIQGCPLEPAHLPVGETEAGLQVAWGQGSFRSAGSTFLPALLPSREAHQPCQQGTVAMVTVGDKGRWQSGDWSDPMEASL